MKNRRKDSAKVEGGRHARPLAVIWRILLSLAVGALLIFALMQTPGVEPPVTFGQMELEETEDEQIRQIDWGSLPDTVVAWVEIPGTSIDEPVAQAQEPNSNYYLYNDALGQGSYGTPYIDCECSVESDFVSVYGHHMSDGTQFAELADYIDPTFLDDHRTIYWYTRADNERHELSTIAVDVVNASLETQRVTFEDEKDRNGYLWDKLSQCDIPAVETEIEGIQIFSFSTCSYQTWNSRTVVYALEPDTHDRQGMISD